MKPWLVCVIALYAGTAYSQTKAPLTLLPGDTVFTRFELKVRDAKRKEYFAFAMTSGVYPLIGITSQPVARFQYHYAGGPIVDYRDQMDTGTGAALGGYTFGFEWGKKKGIFYNLGVGGLVGMTNSRVSTRYFTYSIGYNIPTGIRGVVLQPSIGFAKTTVLSHMTDIPQDQKNILVFNNTLRYKNSCGCTANTTTVTAFNSTSFAQTKLAIKYNINRIISISAAATYFMPLRTTFHLELKNKNNDFKRSGYVSPAATAMQDDSMRDSAVPFYGEFTLSFNLAVTPKVLRAPRPGPTGTHHYHSSGGHGGGGHCH